MKVSFVLRRCLPILVVAVLLTQACGENPTQVEFKRNYGPTLELFIEVALEAEYGSTEKRIKAEVRAAVRKNGVRQH